MTTEEFANEFDVLYNNISSNQSPGLNEYEKSVFLTKAQNEILKNYFNPKGNKYQEGFDGSEKRQIDFSKLIKVYSINERGSEGGITPPQTEMTPFDTRGVCYKLPDDILFIINELAVIQDGDITRIVNIVPMNYTEYSKNMSKPYKQPLKNQGWRLIHTENTTDSIAEIIVKSGSTIQKYSIRYVKKPCPIILTNLRDEYGSVSIDGESIKTECELDSILHPEILQRAVELAKASYTGDINSVIAMGQRSE